MLGMKLVDLLAITHFPLPQSLILAKVTQNLAHNLKYFISKQLILNVHKIAGEIQRVHISSGLKNKMEDKSHLQWFKNELDL